MQSRKPDILNMYVPIFSISACDHCVGFPHYNRLLVWYLSVPWVPIQGKPPQAQSSSYFSVLPAGTSNIDPGVQGTHPLLVPGHGTPRLQLMVTWTSGGSLGGHLVGKKEWKRRLDCCARDKWYGKDTSVAHALAIIVMCLLTQLAIVNVFWQQNSINPLPTNDA